MIEGEFVHHVSLNVTDLAAAKEFYGQILGLEEIPRAPFDFPGAWYRIGNQELHLIVYPETRTLRGTTAIDPMEAHVAIWVKDFWRTVEYLRGRGVPIEVRPVTRTAWSQAYVTDPDGNVIEFTAERRV